MMRQNERQFAVWLHERQVGVLLAHNDFTRFVLRRDYVEDPTRAVMGLAFEQDLAAQHRSNMRIPPWFSNLLPEGRLRGWIARARGVSETRELELLVQVGRDLPGAVRVTEAEGPVEPVNSATREILAGTSGPQSGGAWRFSLAGVALKFSMLQRGDRLTVPAFGEGGDWIVKLPDPEYKQVPLNEYSMMELGRLAGLDVPETRLVHRDQIEGVPTALWRPGEEWAYAVRRFDRGGDRGLVHMEDLAQVRGFYPERKYAGSFETVGALLYRRRDTRSLIEFAKRLAFNILIGNGDAHLKNWTLLYSDPRIPSLSPAYDLVSTSVYRPEHQPEDLGLSFGGSKRFETASLSTFKALERKLTATGADLEGEVRAFVTRVQAAWPQVAQQLQSHPSLHDGIGDGLVTRATSLLRP